MIRKRLAGGSVGGKEAGVTGGLWERSKGQWGLEIRERNSIWFRK